MGVWKGMQNYTPFLGGGSMAGSHTPDPPPRRARDTAARTLRAEARRAALVLSSAVAVALLVI